MIILKKIVTAVVLWTFMLQMVIPLTSVSAANQDANDVPIVGDVNGDDSVDAIDFAVMRQRLLGIISNFPIESNSKYSHIDGVVLWVADVNSDNSFDAIDFAVMRQFLLGFIETFPKTITSATPVVTAKPTPTPIISVTATSAYTADEILMLELVNNARADAGVQPLKFDDALMKVAQLKAQDMVDNNYFSHQSPTYGSPFDMMKQFGISYTAAGENIAGHRTVEAAFNAWMNSDGHKKNILNTNFTYIGIGITSSPTYGKVFVQQFIRR